MGQHLEGALCGQHVKAMAVGVCARCGTFTCLECVCSVAGAVWCAACARRPVEAREDSQVGVELARLLSLLAWFLPPLALVALAVGWHQRRRLQRGELAWSAGWHLRQSLRQALVVLAVWGLILGGVVTLFLLSGGASD
ncbi:hypothetical protein [Pyxidicoccus trucidator]|uniref:hypothetical protein n=1 Tax=Pyxidicoccus trucidator TaxID=2709662 RepID=UPI0013DBA37B|nr:hypothetical protein [Pyxidicoccus trucidator]